MNKQTKKCRQCSGVFEDHLFYANRRVCQACFRARQTAYYATNRKVISKKNLDRYYDQKEK
jgi:hypothetical protein